MRSPARLAVLAVVAAALVPAARTGAQTDDCIGTPYPAPQDPRVGVSSEPIYARHETGFTIIAPQEGYVAGSGTFTVTGAASATVRADEDMGGVYTPPVVGTYTVVAHYRQYRCTDYDHTTYYDVTTSPATFEAVKGLPAHARFHTGRRPAAANSGGDATLIGTLVCPPRDRTNDDDADLALYYERGRRKPTHASPHLKVHAQGGCLRTTRLIRREKETQGFRLLVDSSEMAAQVFAPTRLRVLMEIRVAGKLLGRSYGTFSPVRTGEKVVRR